MVANHSSVLKTLAVDLLNPTPQAEARKHKLKVNKTSTVHDQEAWKTLTPSPPDSCPSAPIILYGRQVPRLFYNHHCLLARPDSRYLPRLLNCSLSTVRIPPSYYHCFCPGRRAYPSLDSSSQDKVSTREKSPENTLVHPLHVG